MNPKPFSSENHFTVPVAMCLYLHGVCAANAEELYGNQRALHDYVPGEFLRCANRSSGLSDHGALHLDEILMGTGFLATSVGWVGIAPADPPDQRTGNRRTRRRLW